MVLALRESNVHQVVMIDALHVIALIICQATFVCIRSAIAIMAQERLEVIVLQMDLIGALVAIPATICRRRHLIIINAGSIPAIATMVMEHLDLVVRQMDLIDVPVAIQGIISQIIVVTINPAFATMEQELLELVVLPKGSMNVLRVIVAIVEYHTITGILVC